MKTILLAIPFAAIAATCLFLTIAAMTVCVAIYYGFYKPLKGFINYASNQKKLDRQHRAGTFYITRCGDIVTYKRKEKV